MASSVAAAPTARRGREARPGAPTPTAASTPAATTARGLRAADGQISVPSRCP
jgi:hypothetical protein